MRKLVKLFLTLFYTFIAKLTLRRFTTNFKANFYTRLTPRTSLGKNVNFNGMKILGNGNVSIGDNFHSGFGCIIMTHNHNYEGDEIPYDDTIIIGDVIIEDNVWFGINVTVLPGVTIGEGAIIQAGSVVVSDIPKYAIAGGHPAKVFKYRNIEHYQYLKSQKKFH
mgnify:CR=1 FL=1